MDSFDEYQRRAAKTDTFDAEEWQDRGGDIREVAFLEKVLGLAGEAGEVVDKIKKVARDKGGVASEEEKEEIIKEVGDVLWYEATIARYLGVGLSEVAARNVEKLESRYARGKIHGEGDNR